MPLAIPEGRGPSGLVRVLNNEQLDKENAKRDQAKTEGIQHKPVIQSLANHLQMHWESAKNTKWFVEERLLKCLRQRKGKYDPDDLNAIRAFGGSEIFMMLTNVKCRSIEAMIRDVMLPAGEKPWGVEPTPVPDLPVEEEMELAGQIQGEVEMIMMEFGPDVVTPEMIDMRLYELRDEKRQEHNNIAKKEAKRVERDIEDNFREGDFYEELSYFIKDFATYPTAFLKGPVVRRKKTLVWEEGEDGKKKPVMGYKNTRTWKRVNPFDIYMAAAARGVNDGYLIERIRLRQSGLLNMKGVDGFDDAAIDEVLMEYNAGTLQDWLWTDQERANLEFRPNEQEDPQAVIEALEYHGDVPGHLLLEWGLDKKKIGNPAEPVPVTAILIGRWVIMARINDDPLARKPYYSASFESSTDSLWGIAPPELMEDCQRVCNATARALVNNMAIASGPQVEVHRDRLDAGENIEKIYPWKIWKTKSDPIGKNREAVHFYQPNPMTEALIRVYEYFFGQAGEQLGVPAYEQGVGSAAGGAGKTAHGLSMLMNAASRIIKDAIMSIDANVIKKIVYDTFTLIVVQDDVDYEGDINVVARASEYLIVAEQLQARRNEWLMATNNPTDMAIIGMDGRAKVLRESSKVLKMNDNVVPTEAEMEMKLSAQPGPIGPDGLPMMPPGGGGGGGGMMPGGPPPQTGLQEKLMPDLERVSNF